MGFPRGFPWISFMLCASKNMGHVAEIRDYASDDSGKTPHPYEQVCSLHVASRDAGADASNPCQSYYIHMFFFCVYHLNRCKAFTCGRWMNHVWNFQFSLPLSIFFSDFPWLIILQRGNPVSIAGCPTKRSMPRLIWSLINSTHLHFPTFAVIATG